MTRPPGLLSEEQPPGPGGEGWTSGPQQAPWKPSRALECRQALCWEGQPRFTTSKQAAAAPGPRPGVYRWAACLQEHQARGRGAGVWGWGQGGAGTMGRAQCMKQVTGEPLGTRLPAAAPVAASRCVCARECVCVCVCAHASACVCACVCACACVCWGAQVWRMINAHSTWQTRRPSRASGRGHAPTQC